MHTLRKLVAMFNSTREVGGTCNLLMYLKGVPPSLSLEIEFISLCSPLPFNCYNLTSST